tara:strand:- start:12774 stop:13790 length:1017 start_codon:yes stop_codon:yes gene_type:complete
MKISIVIPCRNEVAYIEECIDAIYTCELPPETSINVFVVDGMSDDGTREKIAELITRYTSLKIIDNAKQLTPYAFNLGIYEDSNADYIQIVGARHILSKNYLSSCIEILQSNKDIWCVGGKIVNEFTNSVSEIISVAMSTSFGMGIGNFRVLYKSGFTDTVTSPMYPYWVFEKIGFFDEELVRNQDDDFNYRVTKAGGKIYYCNEISLNYYVRGTFSGLWKQFFQYGYWKVYVNQKHKTVTTYRQLIPPLFVVYLFLVLLTPIFGWTLLIMSAIPFCLYLLLNGIFSVRTSKNITQFIQLLITYPILHLSYGLGYLRGVIDFVLFKRKPSGKQNRLSR